MNGLPTPLKRMLLGSEVSIISIKEDDHLVKCVCSFIIWCRSYCPQILLILLEKTVLFISRLKSPKIIISGISISLARSLDFSMLFKKVLSEFGGR